MLHLLVTHPACSPPGGSFMCGEWFPTPHQSMESKGGIPVHKVRQSEAYEKKKMGSRWSHEPEVLWLMECTHVLFIG